MHVMYTAFIAWERWYGDTRYDRRDLVYIELGYRVMRLWR